MEKLSEKAAAISGALTGGVLHVLFGLLVFVYPIGPRGMYGMMYYGMMQVQSPAFEFTAWLGSILLGVIVGAVVGYLIAVFYNWGLSK